MKNADGKWVGYGIGDVGETVKKIQHRLIFAYPKNSHAFDHGVTESGAFDEATRAALIDITTHINHSQGKALRTDGVADFAVQVQAITGRTLDDPEFFSATVDNVQRILLRGILAPDVPDRPTRSRRQRGRRRDPPRGGGRRGRSARAVRRVWV